MDEAIADGIGHNARWLTEDAGLRRPSEDGVLNESRG